MLRINDHTKLVKEDISIGIDIETSGLRSSFSGMNTVMSELIKSANEVNKKLTGHANHYIVVSEQIAKEINKLQWNIY